MWPWCLLSHLLLEQLKAFSACRNPVLCPSGSSGATFPQFPAVLQGLGATRFGSCSPGAKPVLCFSPRSP